MTIGCQNRYHTPPRDACKWELTEKRCWLVLRVEALGPGVHWGELNLGFQAEAGSRTEHCEKM